jgi:hypothetical protein
MITIAAINNWYVPSTAKLIFKEPGRKNIWKHSKLRNMKCVGGTRTLLGHMKPADADTHYMLIQPTAKNICFDPSQLDTKKGSTRRDATSPVRKRCQDLNQFFNTRAVNTINLTTAKGEEEE